MKQKLVIFFFFFSLCAITIFSFVYRTGLSGRAQFDSKSKDTNSESYFKKVDYFSLSMGIRKLKLVSRELIINEKTKDLTFFSPKGTSYSTAENTFNFEAKLGNFQNVKQELALKEQAHLFNDSLDLTCELAFYSIEKDFARCEQKVVTRSVSKKTGDRIKISSERLSAYPAKELSFYEGNVSGSIVRKRKYEPPVRFKSDTADVDLKKSLVNLNDNVWLKQQEISATSQRGEIFLENYNKKLKYFVLYDDVNVKEKVSIEGQPEKKAFFRRALSEKLVGITSEEILVLTGFPKVYQLKDVIRGNRIILRKDSELVEVEDANTIFYLKK